MSISQQELERRVVEAVARHVGRSVEDIPIDESFESLGISSMDAFEILFAVEDEFNLSIPDDDAHGMQSVRSLIDALSRELAS